MPRGCLWSASDTLQRLRELDARMALVASAGFRLVQFSHRCIVAYGNKSASYLYLAPKGGITVQGDYGVVAGADLRHCSLCVSRWIYVANRIEHWGITGVNSTHKPLRISLRIHHNGKSHLHAMQGWHLLPPNDSYLLCRNKKATLSGMASHL